MTPAEPAPRQVAGSLREPVLWGVVVGALQAASPLAFWWLEPATVYALGLALIAAVYIGFAVADGRPSVIVVECVVAAVFVVLAAAGVTGSAWLLVVGFLGHGLKGSLAAPQPLRRQHSMVAAVLPRRGLGRRRGHGRADHRQHPVALGQAPALGGSYSMASYGSPSHTAEHPLDPSRIILAGRGTDVPTGC